MVGLPLMNEFSERAFWSASLGKHVPFPSRTLRNRKVALSILQEYSYVHDDPSAMARGVSKGAAHDRALDTGLPVTKERRGVNGC